MKFQYSMILSLGLVLVSGLGIGCGGSAGQLDVVDASGKVFLDDAPHGPAQLTITPVIEDPNTDSRPTVGAEVQEDGSFNITTYATGDGAPPGEYTAVLGAATAAGTTDPDAMMQMMSGGGGPATTPIKFTIPAEGTNNLEFKFVSTGEKKKTEKGPGIP